MKNKNTVIVASVFFIIIFIIFIFQNLWLNTQIQNDISEQFANVLPSTSTPHKQEPPSSIGEVLPTKLFGVTIQSVENIDRIVESLQKHLHKPTVRIVFQKEDEPKEYTEAINKIHRVSYIMGELLDSEDLSTLSLEAYKKRTEQFVYAFKNKVDIWEVGNEINGEWAIDSPKGEYEQQEVAEKVIAAYDIVEKENLVTGITFSYFPSKDCRMYDFEDMNTWIEKRVPERMRKGLDYVFISWYEEACTPEYRPSISEWNKVFESLHSQFPNSKIGFGEIGTMEPNGKSLANRKELVDYYYGLTNKIKIKEYIGGYFWWYYLEEAVPWNKKDSLWPSLENAFNEY